MTVVLLESIHPEARARLEKAADRVLHEEDPAGIEALARREPVHAFITRGRGQVRAPLMDLCPDLRVVARVGVGVDNIDVAAASKRGVPVVNAPGSTTSAVAEHALLLMGALVRRLPELLEATRTGHWEARRHYMGQELADRVLGIVGMGAIGRRVAELAEAFGMEVRYWSRTPKDVPYPYRSSLHDLLAEADVVSLNVALTPETRRLLGADELARMKPGALLVNTARGGIIDQDALREALDHGPLGGFAADVLAEEPPPAGEPLLGHEKVLLTPHTAAMTENTFRKMSLRTVGNVLAVLRGDAPEPGCLVNAGALGRAQR